MQLWQILKRLLNPVGTTFDETFTLSPHQETTPAASDAQSRRLDATVGAARDVQRRIDRWLEAKGRPDEVDKVGDLSNSLQENLDRVKTIFRASVNRDLIIRQLVTATQPPVKAALIYMEGLADKVTINESILKPLMLQAHLDHHLAGNDMADSTTKPDIETIDERLLPGHQTGKVPDLHLLVEHVLMGDTVLLVDGCAEALSIETKGFPFRNVDKAENEAVIRGPQDAFSEPFRINVALVRRRLKDPRVVTELMTVGRISNTNVALLYIDGLCNPLLIEEVKRRIDALEVDHITDSGILDQFIEDSPTAWLPQSLATERPDRVAAFLTEGHLSVFVDNSPYALIMPINFWSFLQTAEDYYLRYPFGSFLRYLRFIAFLIALLLPAFYIASVNYHQEMLPTDLMLFVAATRETVPIPAVFEIFALDIAWELIREAGVRIPGVIGATLGLVGGIVLGQAAVEARLVSPILVVTVAITGLASFAVPNYVASYALRAGRFAFLVAAAFQGFYGIGVLFFLTTLSAAALKSYGAPFLAPVAPYQRTVHDVLRREPVYAMEERPKYPAPLDRRRQKRVVRPWDPHNPEREAEERRDDHP